MNYEEAAQLMALHKSRVRGTNDPTRRNLKYRTTLRVQEYANEVDRPPEYILKYFNTDIITYCHDHVVISDGGFFSTSTHARFNEFLPRGFCVSGTTYPKLNLRRPLGFVQTPTGTYPYRSHMAYMYNGMPYGARRYHNTRQAVENIPKYVDAYLDKLFAGEKCDVNSAFAANEHWVKGRLPSGENRSVSENAGAAIYNEHTYKFLLLMVGQHFTDAERPPPSLATEVSLASIGLWLAHYGAEAFRMPRNNSEAALSFERALEYGYVPKLKLQALRKYVRQQLINYLVHSLEFGTVEWNRR